MTEQMKELLGRGNGFCFFGWIIVGIYLGSYNLILSSILLSFFILVMRTRSTLSAVLAIAGTVILGYVLS